MSNLLFICSKNQWRSPTAELMFKNHALHKARSAGTSDKAGVRVSEKLLDWADVVFVMERKHREILRQRFGSAIKEKQIIVLDIDDDYQFNDPELVDILKTALFDYL